MASFLLEICKFARNSGILKHIDQKFPYMTRLSQSRSKMAILSGRLHDGEIEGKCCSWCLSPLCHVYTTLHDPSSSSNCRRNRGTPEDAKIDISGSKPFGHPHQPQV